MKKSFIRQLEQAAMLLHEGKLDEAQAAFEAILAQEPNLALANLGLATLFNRIGRVVHAQQILDAMWRELQQLPTDVAPKSLRAEVRAQQGVALEHMHKFEEAKACYNEAQALFPTPFVQIRLNSISTRIALRSDPVTLLHEVARYHLRQKDFQSAEKIYKALLRHDANDGPALDGLANLLCSRGLLDQALTLIQRAIVLYPNNAEYFHTLAIVFQLKQDYGKAVTFYKKALALKPDHEATLRALSHALVLAGRPEEAAHYEAAADALVVHEPEPVTVPELPAPAARTTVKPAPKAKAKPKAKAAAKTKAKAKAKPKPKPKPKAKPKAKAAGKPTTKPAAKSKAAKPTKAKTKAKPKAKTKARVKPVPTRGVKAKPASKARAKATAKNKARAVPKSKARPASKAKATSKTTARPKAAAKPKQKVTRSKSRTTAKSAPRKAAPAKRRAAAAPKRAAASRSAAKVGTRTRTATRKTTGRKAR